MRIRKNGRVVNLTESDLRRITKRVISEQEDDLAGLKECKGDVIQRVVDSLKDMNDSHKIKIEVSSTNKEALIIDHPNGKCGCLKEDFFAKV